MEQSEQASPPSTRQAIDNLALVASAYVTMTALLLKRNQRSYVLRFCVYDSGDVMLVGVVPLLSVAAGDIPAASRLHLAEMVQLPGGSSFVERPIHDRVTGERQFLFRRENSQPPESFFRRKNKNRLRKIHFIGDFLHFFI